MPPCAGVTSWRSAPGSDAIRAGLYSPVAEDSPIARHGDAQPAATVDSSGSAGRARGAGVVHEALDQHRRTRARCTRCADRCRPALSSKREFRSLRDLVHANLIGVDELFEGGGDWCFAMELLDGRACARICIASPGRRIAAAAGEWGTAVRRCEIGRGQERAIGDVRGSGPGRRSRGRTRGRRVQQGSHALRGGRRGHRSTAAAGRAGRRAGYRAPDPGALNPDCPAISERSSPRRTHDRRHGLTADRDASRICSSEGRRVA